MEISSDVRRRNLRRLIEREHGDDITDFAEERNQIQPYKPPELARYVEIKYGLERGWLDHAHEPNGTPVFLTNDVANYAISQQEPSEPQYLELPRYRSALFAFRQSGADLHCDHPLAVHHGDYCLIDPHAAVRQDTLVLAYSEPSGAHVARYLPLTPEEFRLDALVRGFGLQRLRHSDWRLFTVIAIYRPLQFIG